ncbi:hypothetical protein JN535_00815 [Cellulosimicrobium cellulans]|uniref:DUF7507 domain-containing protein n=1 Tax=Cellulosimicrobium cellulans TaxID=1710 RepID=UPI001964960B|nr:hypothetical protein [Cellulosimicrobium cellulans]MBN0038711.1 hypothetical protein [Cellulosimicrobium cellulans]
MHGFARGDGGNGAASPRTRSTAARPARHARTATRRGSRARRFLGAALALVTAGAGLTAAAVPATAATVYEIEAGWAESTPEVLQTGDAVSATWWFNLNDDAAAPGNAPVENVTITVTAQGAVFDALPPACLTDGVDPASSISEDGTVLVCNVGTQDEGTAYSLSTPMRVTAVTGEPVSAGATIADQQASLPEIPVQNAYLQDIHWVESTAGSANNGSSRDFTFNWTLFHGANSPAGPATVTYNLTVANSVGATTQLGPNLCTAFQSGTASGHPWSGGTHDASQTAPFVGSCTLTRNSSTSYTLTLSGIDYSHAQAPTMDSKGDRLPTDRVAVASGQIQLRLVTTAGSGNVSVTSNAPTYTAVDGQTVGDDPANNTSTKNWVSGTWSHAWQPAYTGQSSNVWADTYRVAPETELGAGVRVIYPNVQNQASTQGGLCLVLDTRYVEFTGALTRFDNGTTGEPAGLPVAYYTGNSALVNPTSGSYDPNAFTCDGTTGWTTTAPADLSTVKAVRATYTMTAARWQREIVLQATQRLLPSAQVGQDVWTWGSYINPGSATNTWVNAARSMSPADAGQSATLTPDARYPFAQAGRDIVRIIGVTPDVSKSVLPTTVDPGGQATYTLSYSANGTGSVAPTVDGYQLVDTLPLGATYLAGSASPEPVVTTNGAGKQVLTWTLDGVPTNAVQTLTYDVAYADDVDAGERLVNTVTASAEGVQSETATASVVVNESGLTKIIKTADQAFIPNLTGDGAGEGSWTVLVRSEDPLPQEFVDVIDILPYVGDGRGTAFSGSYQLDGPVTSSIGGTVYYTTADPATLTDDPADATNGAAGDVAGNTVGWTTTYTPDATAVRVITGTLAARGELTIAVPVVTDGMVGGDVLVNRSQGRAENTRLVMRTSASTAIANYYSASLKKYVQDADGEWRDANDPLDYPQFRVGDTVRYRIAVENTGQGTLTNVVVSDDLQPELGSFTIESLAPGEVQTHEFEIVLTEPVADSVVNTACADADVPADSGVEPTINCDPAGFVVVGTPTHTKEIVSATPVGDGQWEVVYEVVVSNTQTPSTTYSLTDELHFTDQATIVSAAVTQAPDGVVLADPAWDGQENLTIASDVPLAGNDDEGYAPHVYRVTVLADVPLQLDGAGTGPDAPTACPAEGSDANQGFNNTSGMTGPEGEVEEDQACAPIPSIDITKTVSAGPTPNGDGTWTVTYDVVATNSGAADGVYEVTDRMTADGDLAVVAGSVTAPDGVTPNASWTGQGDEGAPENVIASGVTLPAGGTHTYQVDVVLGIAEGVEGAPVITPCSAEPGASPGGLSNAAGVEHNDLTDSDEACVAIAYIVVDKSISAGPTPNGDGTWTIVYDIVAENVGGESGEYDVYDRLHYGEGIEILDAAVSTAPDGVETNADWTGLGAEDADPANLVASGVELDAGASHTYQVEVTVQMDEATIDPVDLQCPPPGSGANGGLANSTSLDHNGIVAEDGVCASLPLIGIEKSISGGPTPNGDGTWTITYDLVATNTGQAAGDYDVVDRLQYGEGIVVESAAITSAPDGVEPEAGWTGQGATGSADNLVASGVTLEAGAAHTYQVQVVVSLDREVVTPETLQCPEPGSGESGGLANSTELTHNGETQGDDVCATLPLIDVTKTVSAGPTPNGDGTWTVTYDVVATNSGAADGTYDVTDRMTADGDITVVSGAVVSAPDGVTPSATWTGLGAEGAAENVIATGVNLPAGESHTYQVQVVIALAEGSEGAPAVSDCAAPGTGEDGGLSNSAGIDHNGIPDSDEACVTISAITVDKTISAGPTPNGDGTWTIVYDVVAENVGGAAGEYDVFDRLHYGDGIEIVEAGIITAPDGVETNPDWTGLGAEDADPANLVASGIELAAGGTHTYQVEVTVQMDEATIDPVNLQCPPPGSGENGGLANSTSLDHNGIVVEDEVCASLPLIEFDKSISAGPTPNGDGTWTITYDLVATNTGQAAGDYDLVDRLQYGDGIVVESATVATAPDGVEPNAGWTGQGEAGSQENVVATAVTLEAGATHTYQVQVAVSLDPEVVTPDTLQCPEPGSGEAGGLANAGELTHNGETQDDDVCATLPLIDITKSLSGAVTPVEGEDGVYDVVYEVTVTNRGPGAGVYDLDDTLAPGEGVTVVGIQGVVTDAPESVGINEGFDGLDDPRIVTAQPVDGATTAPVVHTYTVTVRYAVDLTDVVVDPAVDACTTPDGGTVAGGLNNVAQVGWNGIEGTDDECVRPGKPTLDKALVSANPVGDGKWEVVYDLTVGNVGTEATTYDLDDELLFAPVITVDSVAVTGPEGVLVNEGFDGDGDQRIATDVAIGGLDDEGYAPHVYRVTVVADVPLHFASDDVGEDGTGSPACTVPAGSNTLEQGLNNAATLTDETGGTQTDTDCAPVPSIDITKSMQGDPVKGENGSWTVSYTITATNDGAAAGVYDLTDRLRYGAGITVKTATVTATPEGVTASSTWTGQGAEGDPANVVATGVGLPAGATHTYQVQVVASLDAGAVNESTFTCPAPGSDGRGGFANTAGIGHNGLTDSAEACATPDEPGKPGKPGGSLATTGATLAWVAGGAALLLLLGLAALMVARRRRIAG